MRAGPGVLVIAYIVQVLTGEIPFRGVRQTELGYSTVQGVRPDKPWNASAIGLSDPLWRFVQRCWDGDVKLRPKVGEVVVHLEEAVGGWDGLMSPHAQTEDVTFDLREDTPESMQHSEFNISIQPLILPIKQRYRRNLSTTFEWFPGESHRIASHP